jgi:hypothetical protein
MSVCAPCWRMKGMDVQLYSFLASALDEGESSASGFSFSAPVAGWAAELFWIFQRRDTFLVCARY